MAPKLKKSDSQKEDEQHEPLQAVLLTDSYENRFAPFTLEKPRVRLYLPECLTTATDDKI
jgi:hypothetical protein